MNRELREILIGAVTVAVLFAVLIAMNARHELAGGSSDDRLRITAKFNKIDGLAEDSDVRLGGIKIGHVSEMTLDDQFRATVAFELDSAIPLPIDTSAAIHTDGLFGTKFVVLEPGAEETFLKSGDSISFTQDAVVVSDLLDLIISEGHVARQQREAESK